MKKIRIGFKEVNKDLVFMDIDGQYETLRDLVQGYIEYVPSGVPGLDIIINEEGKLIELTPNLYYGEHDVLCGNVIFIRNEEGESASITKEDEDFLKVAIPKITIPEEKVNMLKNNIGDFIRFEFVETDKID